MDKVPNWTAIIGIMLTGIGLIAGILGWWVSKFLADKKDIITALIKIEDLERRMNDVESDTRDKKRRH